MSRLFQMFYGKLSNFNRKVKFGNKVKISNKFLGYLNNVWKMEGDIVYDRAPDSHLTFLRGDLHAVNVV